MNEKIELPSFWVWEKAIPPAVCNQLIEEISNMTLSDGVVGYGEGNIDEKIRNGKTVFLPNNHWFEGILFNHARWANHSAGWGFAMDNCEPLQIASYKTNEKYDWHRDVDLLNRSEGFQRKLSVVCQLSGANLFTGGGLYIRGFEDNSVLQNQGDLVVFPSFLEHKAATVKSGHRLTVVSWVTGRYFL